MWGLDKNIWGKYPFSFIQMISYYKGYFNHKICYVYLTHLKPNIKFFLLDSIYLMLTYIKHDKYIHNKI